MGGSHLQTLFTYQVIMSSEQTLFLEINLAKIHLDNLGMAGSNFDWKEI